MTNSGMRFGPQFFRASPVVALAIAGLLLTIVPAARTEAPPVYAITNARIVPVSASVIEKGTVVLRNGIIEAAGSGISIPRDARVIDGTGLSVYPGLIDSLSDAGIETAAPTAAGAGGRGVGGQPQQAQATSTPEERQGLTPYLLTSDVINPSHPKIPSARSAGITTALIAPRRGVFAGQSCLINLSGSSLARMVVKTPLALHVNIAEGGGFGRQYPASLMGIIAFAEQTLLDAQHYDAAWNIYNSNPGTERPLFSRALQSLQPFLKQQMPVVLSADTPQEIERVLALAAPFKLNVMLSGASQAGPLASMLAQKKIPVLLTVKYPERDRDPDPDVEEELSVLRRRVEAPQNASVLAKAGVRFAFQSSDMTARDFLRNVQRAVESGLDRNVALRALTLNPAEFFGVADRLGSIEKGKTANLVVVTGDLFEQRSRVRYVFVDGEKFEPEPDPETAAGGRGTGMGRGTAVPAAAPAGANITGAWTLSVNSPQGQVAVSLNVTQTGTVLRGTIASPYGNSEVKDGTINGNSFRFTIHLNSPETGELDITCSGTVQGTKMSGNLDVVGIGPMEFTGSKIPG
jgi:imidazolonepropionase-like amidohydrolase